MLPLVCAHELIQKNYTYRIGPILRRVRTSGTNATVGESVRGIVIESDVIDNIGAAGVIVAITLMTKYKKDKCQ